MKFYILILQLFSFFIAITKAFRLSQTSQAEPGSGSGPAPSGESFAQEIPELKALQTKPKGNVVDIRRSMKPIQLSTEDIRFYEIKVL